MKGIPRKQHIMNRLSVLRRRRDAVLSDFLKALEKRKVAKIRKTLLYK
ncbi:MAG: hypothetical protein WCL23_04090 [Candidatus Moraniibacteriota bacterium]